MKKRHGKLHNSIKIKNLIKKNIHSHYISFAVDDSLLPSKGKCNQNEEEIRKDY